jgi:hypothetical protein
VFRNTTARYCWRWDRLILAGSAVKTTDAWSVLEIALSATSAGPVAVAPAVKTRIL